MMEKPIPMPTGDTKEFWDACDRGRLIYQQCPSCQTVQSFPRALCMECGNAELAWRDSTGLGTVLSFTEVHRGPSPAFKPDQPYLLLIVEMDEGFRLMTNARNIDANAVHIGMRVRIGFQSRGDAGRKIPIAEPAN